MDNNTRKTLKRRFDELVYELMHRISHLGTVSRDRLLDKAHHIHMEPGRKLLAKQWQWSLLYLVEGSVARDIPGQGREILQAGDPAADQPLFPQLGSRQSKVVALKTSEVLAFDRRLFELLEEEEELNEKQVDIYDMDATESALFQRFVVNHQRGQLQIPGVPEVAERIGRMVRDSAPDLAQLAHLVELDPALAVRVASVVGGDLRDRGIDVAVGILGRELVREIILEYANTVGCTRHSPLVREQMLKAHRHSVHVSRYCYVLAGDLNDLNPRHALLCGLLHDVGMFPLLCASESFGDHFGTLETLNNLLWKLHGMIGALVLSSWGFDNHIVALAEEADHWQRDTAERAPDYADVVLVAQLHSYIGTDRAGRLPKFSDVPAFQKIAGKHTGPNFSLHVLHQANPRILEVERALAGII